VGLYITLSGILYNLRILIQNCKKLWYNKLCKKNKKGSEKYEWEEKEDENILS
jgi:hypothetical protein